MFRQCAFPVLFLCILSCGTTPPRRVATQSNTDVDAGLSDSIAASSCPENHDDCDGARANGCEVVLTSDPENCGECGHDCRSGSFCDGGECSDVLEVIGGRHHSCARWSTGQVRCWGRNTFGQIGNGTTTDQSRATLIESLGDVAQIALGGSHSCAIDGSGTVYCWGRNIEGQLGLGEISERETSPSQVPDLAGVVQLSLGWRHSCALRSNGQVLCWGDNTWGQVGDGSSKNEKNLPTQVIELEGVAAIAAGQQHSCAALRDGRVACWGRNQSHQLGSMPDDDDISPIFVEGLANVVSLTAGDNHTCALDREGHVFCWGDNRSGQCSSRRRSISRPRRVRNLDSITAIDAGSEFTCARGEGALFCWGSNDHFQLGEVESRRSTSAIALALGSNVDAMAAGGFHACAVQEGSIRCWGANQRGQLGDGALRVTWLPHRIDFSENIVDLALGAHHACALLEDGSVSCWGDNSRGQLGTTDDQPRLIPVTIPAVSAAVHLAVGRDHSCVTDQDGHIICWGRGDRGQLGTGRQADSQTPVPVEEMNAAAGLCAGNDHTCALDREGHVFCWGDNRFGAVGAESADFISEPIEVDGLPRATQIVCGETHSCARHTDGSIHCWGDDHWIGPEATEHQREGDARAATADHQSADRFRLVASTGAARDLAAGASVTCLVDEARSISCWGRNRRGLLGASSLGRVVPPSSINSVQDVNDIAIGRNHACVVSTTGEVSCWGDNSGFQLGSETPAFSTTPLRVNNLDEISRVDTSDGFTCVLSSARHQLFCWGASESGQIGNGASFHDRPRAMTVVFDEPTN